MTPRLKIKLSPKNNLPYAVIPHEVMWSFVEYLGCRRVHVAYSYQEKSFTVCFIHSDAAAAQEILDDWHAFESDTASNAALEQTFSNAAIR